MPDNVHRPGPMRRRPPPPHQLPPRPPPLPTPPTAERQTKLSRCPGEHGDPTRVLGVRSPKLPPSAEFPRARKGSLPFRAARPPRRPP
jgi:hypothetical protein